MRGSPSEHLSQAELLAPYAFRCCRRQLQGLWPALSCIFLSPSKPVPIRASISLSSLIIWQALHLSLVRGKQTANAMTRFWTLFVEICPNYVLSHLNPALLPWTCSVGPAIWLFCLPLCLFFWGSPPMADCAEHSEKLCEHRNSVLSSAQQSQSPLYSWHPTEKSGVFRIQALGCTSLPWDYPCQSLPGFHIPINKVFLFISLQWIFQRPS